MEVLRDLNSQQLSRCFQAFKNKEFCYSCHKNCSQPCQLASEQHLLRQVHGIWVPEPCKDLSIMPRLLPVNQWRKCFLKPGIGL